MGDLLQGRRALVTGGGTGIGRAIALRFAQEGASVVVCGRRHGPLANTAEMLRRHSPASDFVECDISDPADVEEMVAAVESKLGGLEILVNNAGVYQGGSLEEADLKDWDRIFSIDLRGVFLVTKACFPMLKKSAPGSSALQISSTLGQMGEQGTLAYSCAKAGMDMFTRCCALDYAAAGIRFNTVSPAVIDTPIHADSKSRIGVHEWQRQMSLLHPMQSVGEPRDIAEAALFLVSEQASWITGANLPVDGGMTAR